MCRGRHSDRDASPCCFGFEPQRSPRNTEIHGEKALQGSSSVCLCAPPCPLWFNTATRSALSASNPSSVLVRIELLRPRHHDDERPERVQHLDRSLLRLQHVGK